MERAHGMNYSLKPLAQEAAWKNLLKLSGSIPQSTVFIGPSGVGKKRTAKAFFQWINCEDRTVDSPCGVCSQCRKISENRHADLIEIAPEKDQILVDDLREMKKTLFFPPIEGKMRFILIDQAHKLNAASANSILKILEEPPAHTRFFLITHERGLLLPTIVSRSQFVHFSPLDEATLKTLLAQMEIEIPAHLFSVALDLLAGGLERASLFTDEKVISFLETALKANSDAISGMEGWQLEIFLDLLITREHKAALAAVAEPALANTHSQNAWQAVQLQKRLSRNANKKLIALATSNLAKEL
jgi:DNA polymerase III delta' subunit